MANRCTVVSGVSNRRPSSIAGPMSSWFVLHRVELFGVGEQQVEQVARRPVGGLQAGGQQQPQKGVDGLVGQLLAVDLGGDEIADDVLGGMGLALVHLLEEVVLQCRRRFERLLVLDGVADQVDGPLPERRQILLR